MNKAHDDVLMIGWEYPPQISGGLGVACEGMTKALSDSNTQIYFTLPFNLKGQVDHMKVISCVDQDRPYAQTQIPFAAYTKIFKKLKDDSIDAVELRSLPQSELEFRVEDYKDNILKKADRLKENDYKIIHAHDWMSFPAAMNLKKKTQKPFVAHIHSTEYDRIPSGHGSQYITQTEYQGMQLADRIISVSYYTKKLLVDKYGIDSEKIDVVYNGLQDTFYDNRKVKKTFANKRPVVAFMGRLTVQKGPDYFIQVAKKVLEVMPNCLFVLAGKGDMYHELLFSVADNHLSASVLFSGFVRDKQKRKLLDRADAFIMPSLSEPFGLVALEAAKHHTPVIVSKNSGVSEVMKSSIAVDFWDIDQTVDVVLDVLEDQGFSSIVARNQAVELNDLTWDKSARKIKDVYRKAFFGE